MKKLLRIFKYALPYKGRMAIMLGCMLSATLISLVPVAISKDFINVLAPGALASVSTVPDQLGGAYLNRIIASGDTWAMIEVLITVMIAVALVRTVLSLLQAYLFEVCTSDLVKHLVIPRYITQKNRRLNYILPVCTGTS